MSNKNLLKLLQPGIIGAVLVAIFVGIVGGALHKPRPNELPVGVVAPAPVAAQLQKTADSKMPGAIDIQAYATASDAVAGLRKEKVLGVIALQPNKLAVTVSSAYGEAPKQLITTLASGASSSIHMPVAVTDLTPKASNPGQAMVMMFLFLLTTVAALIGQVILQRRQHSFTFWLGGTALAAVLVGLSGAATANLLDEFGGAFWGVALALTVYGLACASVIAGLQNWMGQAGIGIAALLLIPLGVATSGAIISSYFLPDFYASISPFMLSSATVDAIRQAAYLDNTSVGQPYAVLTSWLAAGIALSVYSKPASKKKS